MYSNDLDLTPEFPAIYRQEPNKMSDDDLLKILSDFRKSEKMSKLTVIPGWLSININLSNEQVPSKNNIYPIIICILLPFWTILYDFMIPNLGTQEIAISFFSVF